MWRRSYLVLLLVRAFFALSPSYIHPDEHFQGPEIIAGEIFGWPVHRTWEFTSQQPIRSVFPLWLIYGLPLTLLKWISEGLGYGSVSPDTAFLVLRLTMFMLSFVLEDWAIDELIPQLNQRRTAIFFISSSFVTWVFQTRTLSNAIETLIVLWSIVLIRRICENKERTQVTACMVLAFLGVLGIFNRITFPAFLTIPALQLLPHLFARPKRIFILASTALVVALYAIALDSEYYSDGSFHLRQLPQHFVFTPFNNLIYNLKTSNLAEHGLHPFWQHFVANLPQLVGPAIPLLVISSRRDDLYWTGILGIAILSIFQHQEPRFLIPAVPLLLASIKLPRSQQRAWLGLWLAFNILAGLLFGVFHQAGVVRVQSFVDSVGHSSTRHVIWWKTYSPPRWLLGNHNSQIDTTDLMGMKGPLMLEKLENIVQCDPAFQQYLLVAPNSATFLDLYKGESSQGNGSIYLKEAWRWSSHIGLDDLDFGDDGVWPTIARVIGRRGLLVYDIRRDCKSS